MRSNVVIFWVGLLFVSLAHASCQLETQTWDSLPHLNVRPSANGLQVKAKNFTLSEVKLWDVHHHEGQSFITEQANVLLAGNYHWLQSIGQWQSCQVELATSHYDGKPDISPRGMLKIDKASLVISPVDLPREHRQFRGTESWWFEIRQQGYDVANRQIYFWDSVGHLQVLLTDEKGRFHLTFPSYLTDDNNVHADHNIRRESRSFALWVASDNEQMLSGFEYRYTPNPESQHDLFLGTLLAIGGMLLSLLLFVRFKKPKKHRAVTEETA